ncbi:trimeric intracellular cation channel family protein [Xanthomonas vasicola]|uniref:trimeric intracellular cation channel family protein n=1 Tax=Xanthomonas vasicola TaxID=56459 RepID=UPI000531C35B|nr:trimeric intracellular cation channel family protein [Xanthomonas vasicola]KGR53009.1 membrane protein [Xanthomonas vasicola]
MATVLFLLDLLGTFVFALSGATVAVRNRLDLFGVLVLSCAAAVSGGIVRDVLIGTTPPAALVQPQYLLVACVAGFYWHAAVERLRNPVQIFDAAGLALFAVYGTSKALDYHLSALSATLLGMLSGIGGGIARDLLVARTPVVLQAELYAVAALAGGGLVAIGHVLDVPQAWSLATGAGVCFGLRFMAIRYGWHLPVARAPE